MGTFQPYLKEIGHELPLLERRYKQYRKYRNKVLKKYSKIVLGIRVGAYVMVPGLDLTVILI